jgi:hypothetical protein
MCSLARDPSQNGPTQAISAQVFFPKLFFPKRAFIRLHGSDAHRC